MATITNIFLLLFTFSTILLMGFSVNAPTIQSSQIYNNTQGQLALMNSSATGLTNSINTQFTIPSIGTITFPNVFGIFVNTFNILVSLLSSPLAIFAGLADIGVPSIFTYTLTVLLMLVAIFSVINWYKGVSS